MLSLFAMLSVADRVPEALGLNTTVNVEEPLAATLEAGCTDTVKSALCVPPTATRGEPLRLKGPLPVL